MSERTVIEYRRPNPRPPWQAGSTSVVLVLVQFLWAWPAAFGAWVLLCNAGLIHSAAANIGGAALVVAPSVAAVAFGANVVWRRQAADRQRGYALIGIIGGLLWIAYVCAATTRELLHPSPNPCL